jgi:outer membrane protein
MSHQKKLGKMINKSILVSCLALLCSLSYGQDTIPLQDVLKQALMHNFDVIVASGDAQIAGINNAKGEAGMLPTVSAGVFDTYSTNDLLQRFANGQEITSPNAGGNQFGAFVQLDWVVFDGLRMFHSKRRLEALDEQAKINLQLRMLDISRQVANAYAELQRLETLIEFSSQLITIAEERKQIEKMRWEAGLVAKSNFMRSGVSLNQLVVSNLNYKSNYSKTLGTLNALIGVERSMMWWPSKNAEATLEFENILIGGVETNANIKLLLIQQQVRNLELKQAKAGRFPTVALNGAYNFNRVDNTAGFSLLNRTYGPQAGITINMPLFNAGSINRNIKRGEVLVKQSEALVSAERIRTAALLEGNKASLAQIESILKIEKETIAWSKELVDIEMERLRKGQTDITALYQIQTDYENAAIRLSDAIYQRTITYNEIKFILGNVQ